VKISGVANVIKNEPKLKNMIGLINVTYVTDVFYSVFVYKL